MPLNSVLPPPPILPVTALQEQHFNEAALAAPVTHAALRAWTYPEPAVVLGRAQHQLALPAASVGALPVVVRGAGGGAVLTGPSAWLSRWRQMTRAWPPCPWPTATAGWARLL